MFRNLINCLLLAAIPGLVLLSWPASPPGMFAAGARPAGQPELPDGLYLVMRWTSQQADLLPLLDGEVLIEFDPRQIEPESDDPKLFVTVGTTERILFQQLRQLDPVPQDDGRTSLQVTLADEATARLETMSRTYLGRQVATVIGGRAVTLHKIRSVIRNGQLQITRCTDDGCRVILERLQDDVQR